MTKRSHAAGGVHDEPARPGKSPGEPCAADDECSQGNVCYLGRCQRGGP